MLATLPEYPWNNALHTAVVNRSQLGLRLAWVGAGAVPEENIGGAMPPQTKVPSGDSQKNGVIEGAQ